MFKEFFKYHFPVIAYLIIIFIFSSIPGDNLPDLSYTISDKIIHALIYFFAFLLFYISLSHTKSDSFFHKNAILFSIIFATIYALSDEFHQSFVPNRDADIFDFLADFAGVLVGFIFIIILGKIKFRKIIL